MLLIEQMSIFERENSSAINRIKIAIKEGRNFYLFVNDETSYDYAIKSLSTVNASWGSTGLPLRHPNRSFEWLQTCQYSILEVNFSLYTRPTCKVWVTEDTRMKDWEQIHLG